MPCDNLINVQSRITLSSVSRLQRNKVGRLSNPFKINPYGVMMSHSLRKNNHEVHINGLKFPSWNLNNLIKSNKLDMFCPNMLTIRTFDHIFYNILLHSIPPIYLVKVMIHLGGTWMYGISRTMTSTMILVRISLKSYKHSISWYPSM